MRQVEECLEKLTQARRRDEQLRAAARTDQLRAVNAQLRTLLNDEARAAAVGSGEEGPGRREEA